MPDTAYRLKAFGSTDKIRADEEGRIAHLVPLEYAQEDPYLSWFYRPHTILFLVLCVSLLLYYAVFREVQTDIGSNFKVGLLGSNLMFLLFSMLQMRDGLLRRPHPALWRIVTGVGVLYMIFLVFVLFQTVDDARMLLSYYDPALGQPLPERSYATDCRIYTPESPTSNFQNLVDTINDEFIAAHFFGWWLKAIMLRDSVLCWILSVVFELLELSLQHLLENFKECWWDHLILDIIICNGAGILMGIKTCRLFAVKEYSWFNSPESALAEANDQMAPDAGEPGKKVRRRSLSAIMKEGGKHLVPEYDVYQWDILSTPKRMLSVLFICLIVMMVELNAFFLKYVLWIPAPHHLNICRLFLWFFIGLPALRELYQFATDSTCKKLGTNAWLACLNCGIEALVWLKFSKGMFPNPWPPIVLWTWGICIVGFIIWSFVFFTHKNIRVKISPFLSSSAIPLKED